MGTVVELLCEVQSYSLPPPWNPCTSTLHTVASPQLTSQPTNQRTCCGADFQWHTLPRVLAVEMEWAAVGRGDSSPCIRRPWSGDGRGVSAGRDKGVPADGGSSCGWGCCQDTQWWSCAAQSVVYGFIADMKRLGIVVSPMFWWWTIVPVQHPSVVNVRIKYLQTRLIVWSTS